MKSNLGYIVIGIFVVILAIRCFMKKSIYEGLRYINHLGKQMKDRRNFKIKISIGLIANFLKQHLDYLEM